MEQLKANELRIGNLINYWDYVSVDWEISKVNWAHIKIQSIDPINNYQPIPLTEEWLLKFGFEVYSFDYKENQYRFKDRLIVIRDGLFCDYGTDIIINHVHQLQNLYFALTGEELTFKQQDNDTTTMA